MKTFIGFAEALERTLAAVAPAGEETLPLERAAGRHLAEDVVSLVDSPSLTTSRKDGFAVIGADLAGAAENRPVALELVGSLHAGAVEELQIRPGQTVRVTTGAPLPAGADAVISEEYCRLEGRRVICRNTAGAGRNVLFRGTDIARGEVAARRGEKLTPPVVGLLAAAGRSTVHVYRPPRAAVIATGDEVVAAGAPLARGQLYASNLMEICAWLDWLGIPWTAQIVDDDPEAIEAAVTRHVPACDLFLTSGGAWGSRKDLILEVLQTLGWEGVYRRVRMGPGKPVTFGRLQGRPFFVLPGGPPSMEMAFLQLALPAIARLAGGDPRVFPVFRAQLTDAVHGEPGWTNFIHGRLEQQDGRPVITPLRPKSRLKSMAHKNAVAVLPEELSEVPAGGLIDAQLLAV